MSEGTFNESGYALGIENFESLTMRRLELAIKSHEDYEEECYNNFVFVEKEEMLRIAAKEKEVELAKINANKELELAKIQATASNGRIKRGVSSI